MTYFIHCRYRFAHIHKALKRGGSCPGFYKIEVQIPGAYSKRVGDCVNTGPSDNKPEYSA